MKLQYIYKFIVFTVMLLVLNACDKSPKEAKTSSDDSVASKVELSSSDSASTPSQIKKEYSPYVNRDHPQNVYWGDSHVHTSYSWDAGLVGNTLGPDEAYRFAKGEQVISSTNIPAKLVRPLDWIVVADHAESLGVSVLIERSDPAILASDVGRTTHDLLKAGDEDGAMAHWALNVIFTGIDGT